MTEHPRRRLFIAVGVDPATRALVAAHLEAQGAGDWADRLVMPENWHVTLRFLGWTGETQRDVVLRSLDEAELPPPFRMRLGSLGAFPKARRATVTWLAIESGTQELERLAAAAEDAAAAAGFPPEDRPFHPHLTVGRVRPPIDVTRRIEEFEPCRVAMTVDRVTVFESHLGPGGARYEALDEVPLR